ncbi:hypothetical protein [Glycomyces harbinensis]|uniref:Uncharacterized protein n=1 Tax=Glycomyces harbinensis TaxID=58114 RepID=A0A1G6QTW4_9ACTN|nr:hypothetical protein [Glycomyces harbinensis]SDC95889.1 hypothetical protein SAMN05216270_101117 [Glycomyces harbinensis]
MLAALMGFGGALAGALAVILGGLLVESRRARIEEQQWRRGQLAEGHEQALRYLTRATFRRTGFIDGNGRAVISLEHQREWFDDLAEAQAWLRVIVKYSDPDKSKQIGAIADNLDTHVLALLQAEKYSEKGFSMTALLRSCISALTEQPSEAREIAPTSAIPIAPPFGTGNFGGGYVQTATPLSSFDGNAVTWRQYPSFGGTPLSGGLGGSPIYMSGFEVRADGEKPTPDQAPPWA